MRPGPIPRPPPTLADYREPSLARVGAAGYRSLIPRRSPPRRAASPYRRSARQGTLIVGPLPFAAASFDVVFSKDSLVQIPHKSAIFAEILRVLRPGGRFIASDWLRGGSGAYSPEMTEFFRLEGIAYNMATLAESAQALRAAGFAQVEIRDRHGWYLDLAQRELEAMQGPLNAVIVQRIGPLRARHFIDNWQQLVVVLKRGELRPGHFKAVKPF